MKFAIFALICFCVIFSEIKAQELQELNVYKKETHKDGISIAWRYLSSSSLVSSKRNHFSVYLEKLTEDDSIIAEEPLVKETSAFYLELTYAQDDIQPCSEYKVTVSAVYNDSRTTNSSFIIKTFDYSGPFLKKLTCTPTPNNTINIEIEPSSDFLTHCKITKHSYYVYVRGFSKWNEVKEIIPEFQTSDTSFVLAGLYPYSEYNIEIRESRSKHLEKTSVVTLPTVPGSVSNVKIDCTSRQSISVDWSPVVEANGIINQYWIEAINLYLEKIVMHRVDTQFTSANIQRISPNTAYHFVVWAENEAGNGTTSDIVPITISC